MSVDAALKLALKLAAAAMTAPERMIAMMMEIVGSVCSALQTPLQVKGCPGVSVDRGPEQLVARGSRSNHVLKPYFARPKLRDEGRVV